jgi:hypothetical protein
MQVRPNDGRLESVKAGVAGGAERNQQARVMEAGPTVMDDEFPIRPTAPAAAAIPV